MRESTIWSLLSENTQIYSRKKWTLTHFNKFTDFAAERAFNPILYKYKEKMRQIWFLYALINTDFHQLLLKYQLQCFYYFYSYYLLSVLVVFFFYLVLNQKSRIVSFISLLLSNNKTINTLSNECTCFKALFKT